MSEDPIKAAAILKAYKIINVQDDANYLGYIDGAHLFELTSGGRCTVDLITETVKFQTSDEK